LTTTGRRAFEKDLRKKETLRDRMEKLECSEGGGSRQRTYDLKREEMMMLMMRYKFN